MGEKKHYARRDHRLNILRLHDEKNLANPVYQAALSANGYLATGLYDTVETNFTPILCATYHASEALGAGGYLGVKSLSASLHGFQGLVVDRKTGLRLNAEPTALHVTNVTPAPRRSVCVA